MLTANDVDSGPHPQGTRPLRKVARRHQINLCCASSVQPMVAEVARCLEGLGFRTTVACGAAARAALLSDDDEAHDDGPAPPTIHVVCVQGQLRDRVLAPLRRALADRDQADQPLFVAVLDLAMPLAMVGPIRRFAEALDHPAADDAARTGAERRQWREHIGTRKLSDAPTRDYRPLQVIDRTAAPSGAPESSAPPKTRRRPQFSATGPLTRVGATGKYEAIAAGRVTQVDAAAAVAVGLAPLGDETARYRVDGLDTGSHRTVDSLDTTAQDPNATPPRVGLASLLAEQPSPADAEPLALASPLATPSDVGDSADTVAPAAMAKVALRRLPTGTFPAIVERPTKRSALGERRDDRSERKPAPVADATPDAGADAASDAPADAPARTMTRGTVPRTPHPIVTLSPRASHPARPVLWGVAVLAVVGVAWLALRPPGAAPQAMRDLPADLQADASASGGAVAAGLLPASPVPEARSAPADRTPHNRDATASVAIDAHVGSTDETETGTQTEPEAEPEPDAAAATGTHAGLPAGTEPVLEPAVEAGVPDAAGRETPPAPPPTPRAAVAPAAESPAARLAAAADLRRIQAVGDLYVARPTGSEASAWRDASRACKTLAIEGVDGWRLPWRRELKLVAVSLGLRTGQWWSRSKVAASHDMVYALDAATRDLQETPKTDASGGVVCVLTMPESTPE